MARGAAALLAFASLCVASGNAGAVVKGTSTPHGAYTVRVVGGDLCSGVLISHRLVATAAHCGRRGMGVYGKGGSARVIGLSDGAFLDDGRFVSVSGDAVIMTLSRPLRGPVATVGIGQGDIYTIVGYGARSERRGGYGRLREARLMPDSIFALVDPFREGRIGASACFGDSGGPVMRDGVVVGIITRAAHPEKYIACGHLTRWTPITASALPGAKVAIVLPEDPPVPAAKPSPDERKITIRRTRHRPQTRAQADVNFFQLLFGQHSRKKLAHRN